VCNPSRSPTSKLLTVNMSVKLQQDQVIDLISPMLTGSAQTMVVTKEGISVSVPTNLFKIFSKTLSALLDVSPCITTSIILPECSLSTLQNIIEILTKGYSRHCKITEDNNSKVLNNIIEVSNSLGLDLSNMNFERKGQETILAKSKQTRKLEEDKGFGRSSKSVKNIKEEEQELNLAFQCFLCNKTFKSATPLGYHYCKHLINDLQALDLSESIQNEKCLKCERTFFDNNAMLSHFGVKHGYINEILEAKGLPQLLLEDDNPSTPLKVKTENREQLERSCELCIQDFSSVPVSSLAYHYCNHFSDKMQTYFSTYYFNKTCKICKKSFGTIDKLMVHIGVRHGKINNILNSVHLKPLRFPKKKKAKTTSADLQTTPFANEKVLRALREPKQERGSSYTNEHEQQFQVSRKKLEAKICFICDKTNGNLALLKQHICTHFWDELKIISAEIVINGKTCGICNEDSQNLTTLMKHIAITHGKLDEILDSKGYPTLNKNSRKLPIQKEKVSRKYSTSDIKEIRECEICNKELESLSKLGQHMVSLHFFKEIRETYNHLYNGKECTLCNNSYTKNTLVMHIGATHNKLDEVLVKNGYRPLKTKIVPNFKKITIKKERPDATESTNELDYFEKNSQEDQSSNEAENLIENGQSSTDDSLNATNQSETLDEISLVDTYSVKYI